MTQPARANPSAPRMLGVDIARFLALAGMFAAHTWDRTPDGGHTLIGELVAGRAAALFAVLAGIGITFVTGRTLAEGAAGAARLMLVGRGAALLVIGLALGLLPTNIFVIIAYYGLLFVVLAPLVAVKGPWLVAIAGAAAIVGPSLNVAVRERLGVEYEVGTPSWLDIADPVELARALLLTGIYPAITWVVYGVIGILIGRRLGQIPPGVQARRFGWRLAGAGAAAALAGWAASAATLSLFGGRTALAATYGPEGDAIVDILLSESGTGAPLAGSPVWLAVAMPHTGTIPDLAVTAGIGCAVIGGCLAAFATAGARLRTLVLPFAGAGAAPLSVYSLHIVLTAAIPWAAELLQGPTLPYELTSSPGLWIGHLLVALALGTLLATIHRRGPFETLVTLCGRALAGRTRRRPPAAKG